jgi:hypothetical protein
MNTQSRKPATQAEMQLARLKVDLVEKQLERLEINLNLIVDYAKLTHVTPIEVKAKQCMLDIEDIKKHLEKYG